MENVLLSFSNNYRQKFLELHNRQGVIGTVEAVTPVQEQIGFYFDELPKNTKDDISFVIQEISDSIENGRLNGGLQIYVRIKKELDYNLILDELQHLSYTMNETTFDVDGIQALQYFGRPKQFSMLDEVGTQRFITYTFSANYYLSLATNFKLSDGTTLSVNGELLDPDSVISLSYSEVINTSPTQVLLTQKNVPMSLTRSIQVELLQDDSDIQELLSAPTSGTYPLFDLVFTKDNTRLSFKAIRNTLNMNVQKGKYLVYQVSFVEFDSGVI